MAIGYVTPKDLQAPKDDLIVIQPKAQIIIENAMRELAENLQYKMPEQGTASTNFSEAIRYLCGRVATNIPGIEDNMKPTPLTAETKAIYNEMRHILRSNISEFYRQIIEHGGSDPDKNKDNYKQFINKLTVSWDKANKKLTLLGEKTTGPFLTKIGKKIFALQDYNDRYNLEKYITEVGLKDYYKGIIGRKAQAKDKITVTREALSTRTEELWEIVRATEQFYALERVIATAGMAAPTIDYKVPDNMLKYLPASKPFKCNFPKTNSKHIKNIKIVDHEDIKTMLEKYDSVNYEDLNGNIVYFFGDSEKLKIIEEKSSAQKIGRE